MTECSFSIRLRARHRPPVVQALQALRDELTRAGAGEAHLTRLFRHIDDQRATVAPRSRSRFRRISTSFDVGHGNGTDRASRVGIFICHHPQRAAEEAHDGLNPLSGSRRLLSPIRAPFLAARKAEVQVRTR